MINSFRVTTTGWTGFEHCLRKRPIVSRSSSLLVALATILPPLRWCRPDRAFIEIQRMGSSERLILGAHYGHESSQMKGLCRHVKIKVYNSSLESASSVSAVHP